MKSFHRLLESGSKKGKKKLKFNPMYIKSKKHKEKSKSKTKRYRMVWRGDGPPSDSYVKYDSQFQVSRTHTNRKSTSTASTSMPSSSMHCTATSTPLQCLNHVTGKGKAKLQGPLANLTIPDSSEDPQVIKHVKKKKRKNDDMDEQPNDDSDDIPLQALFKRKGKNDDMDNQPNDDSDDIPLQALFERKASSSKNRGKKRKACVNKDVMVDPVPKISLHSMPGLKTRSSPAQFARLISILKPKQRDSVYNMGFGQLLTFKCDGIPSKIGYFVVDNFDPQEMEIKAATSSVKVDSVSINKLLGIPMGSKSFLKSKRSKRRDPAVNEWRKRYPNKDVSPKELVDQVMSSPDEDSFNFRMDFLMCFICVMVDCSSQGRVKQKIAKKVYSDIDWSDINFCEYILQVLKDCKNGWKPSSNFNGPLTILTLLYVDSFVCEGMDIDEDKNAISFWNMENLQVRQKMEARNGGFGLGEKKELSHVVDDGTSVLVKSGLFVSLSEMLSEASKNIDCLLSAIVSADTSIRNLIEEFPEAPEVGDDLQSDSSSEDASDDENKEELHDSGDDANHGEDHQSDYDTDSGDEGNVPHDEETNESGDEDTGEQEDNGSDGEESESQQSTKSATEDSQSEEQSKSGSGANELSNEEDKFSNHEDTQSEEHPRSANQDSHIHEPNQSQGDTSGDPTHDEETKSGDESSGTEEESNSPNKAYDRHGSPLFQTPISGSGANELSNEEDKFSNHEDTQSEEHPRSANQDSHIHEPNQSQGDTSGDPTHDEETKSGDESSGSEEESNSHNNAYDHHGSPLFQTPISGSGANDLSNEEDAEKSAVQPDSVVVHNESVENEKIEINTDEQCATVDNVANNNDAENSNVGGANVHEGSPIVFHTSVQAEPNDIISDVLKDINTPSEDIFIEPNLASDMDGFSLGVSQIPLPVDSHVIDDKSTPEKKSSLRIDSAVALNLQLPGCPNVKTSADLYPYVFSEEPELDEQQTSSSHNLDKADHDPKGKRVRTQREIAFSSYLKSPYFDRGVTIEIPFTKEENNLWDLIMKETPPTPPRNKRKSVNNTRKFLDASDSVFYSITGAQVSKSTMSTLNYISNVDSNVLKAFTDVMNWDEKKRSDSSPHRLFLPPHIIDQWTLYDVDTDEAARLDKFDKNVDKLVKMNNITRDLKGVDMVFIPVEESELYYLLVFELKYPAISVIDSLCPNKPLINLIDHGSYEKNGSAYKMKQLFCGYLDNIKHPKSDKITPSSIERVAIDWATASNFCDNIIFCMRHMEKYMGRNEVFECEFASHGSTRKAQLRKLRKKYVSVIMLSDANLLKSKINCYLK
ncbi:hypothetical protein SSX86_000546 [Deinandra increscens subsp. villosa]|uniref:Ubiquitin-like protease family profile domain-containing protein n=1 Tax=Deinandra increscens subsp. villosa TaxID=3103831 RepID=A0AAP0HA63_9ASTR